jgi:hypothetical protein
MNWTIKKKGANRIGRSINHIISLKICKERSDWIILPKLTNQNNSIIRTLKWIVNNCLYSARNRFSTCTHVGFFQLYVHDFYSTWNTYYSTWMGILIIIYLEIKFLRNRRILYFGGHFLFEMATIANQRWISIRNIIIYLETKFRSNRRIFAFWRPFWIQNGHHNKSTIDINSQHHNLLGN